MLIPADAEVEREVTPLLVVERPLEVEAERDPTLLALELIPLEAEVEREETPLLVDERPVDTDATPL